MRYDKIEYMHWTKSTYSHWNSKLVDFGASGVPMQVKTLDKLGIDGSRIPLAGPNHYGYGKLREGIAARYGVKPEQVYPADGTSMANYLLLSTLIRPGDVVLVETPVYECMSAPVESLGGKIEWIYRKEANGWALDTDDVIGKARNGAKGIFISNSHNPSGQYTPDDVLIEIADAVGENVFVLIDEVYREGLPEQAGKTIATKRPNLYSTSSLTKIWGFGGLRCGWAIAPEPVIGAMYLAYDHLGVHRAFAHEWILGKLFTDAAKIDHYRSRALAHLATNRALVDEFLKTDEARRIATIAPPAGGFGFWRVKGMAGDTAAQRLKDEAGVFVVPGTLFNAPEGFRVGWTQDQDTVRTALERVAGWLRSL